MTPNIIRSTIIARHRKESALGVAFINEHYPIMFREKLLSSLLDKMNISKIKSILII